MAAGIFEAIGLVSGLLGIVQFGIDNFAEPESTGSTIRVAVGLDYDGGLSNAGGDLPDMRLFNEAGEFIGMVADPGDKLESGGFDDVFVKHKGDSTQQATYTLFSANDDAICIAYASITWPDGDQYAWVGDWGRQCGATWYYSNRYISGTSTKPDCMWIDADGDQPQTGFQIHWPDFSKANTEIPDDSDEQAKVVDRLCNAGPPFKYYDTPDPNSITHWVLGSRGSEDETTDIKRMVGDMTAISYGPATRFIPARLHGRHPYRRSNSTVPGNPGPRFNNLIVDNDAGHGARDLCESSTSLGPDFINVADGTFCHMADKTLWPVCDEETSDNCFNADTHQLIINGVSARDTPYAKIIDWTST